MALMNMVWWDGRTFSHCLTTPSDLGRAAGVYGLVKFGLRWYLPVLVGLLAAVAGAVVLSRAEKIGQLFGRAGKGLFGEKRASSAYMPGNMRIAGIGFIVLGILVVVVSIVIPLSSR